ncbi:MAG: hypothetical protein CL944_02315 [Candidatus Diapherotrites archaeon]|uniref:ABC transporter permease n=1 Tax=Candidatus Iainarchaeum sp. TaxID=3101447 RepID=A0A2D6LQ19_9ARCH|nr:hypothetical protein [Candidatus Diapherotrites archaeon]|tara:strand:+ start:31346 stop:32479 length:1134 start_codon:yes stop_codon:yes gene_type:complete
MIKLSFFNLFRRKTRTFLSLVGIAIGVAAIIVLVSLVDGFTEDFNDLVSGFKAISVFEKDVPDNIFSKIDASFVQKMESISGVKYAVAEVVFIPEKIDGVALLAAPGSVSAFGIDARKYYSTPQRGFIGDTEKGLNLDGSDLGYVVIGSQLAEDYGKFVGSTIKINDTKFRVKGILEEGSDLLGSLIVMNIEDAREVSEFPSDKIQSMSVFLSDPTQDKKIAKLIELKYADDLQVYTQQDISEEIGGVMDSLRLMAVVVALVSSLVAGIGIANTILMSVLERFKEIGALKAVGWTNSNVMKMILYEAFFLGVIGGVLGIILGFIVDELLSSLVGIKYLISPSLLVTSFLFAVALGLVSGLYPAYQASKLDPIEALRS